MQEETVPETRSAHPGSASLRNCSFSYNWILAIHTVIGRARVPAYLMVNAKSTSRNR